jgi:hypothetical protein
MPTYDAQGVYRDERGNPAPNPADASPGISQGISNLLGMPFTPGRDSGLPHETPIDPVHALQALESGKSGWGTYMPIQVGTTGGTVPMRGINEAQLATQQSGVQTAMPGGPMNLTGESTLPAEARKIPPEKPANIPSRSPDAMQMAQQEANLAEGVNLPPIDNTAATTTAAAKPEAEAVTKQPAQSPVQPADTSGQAGFERLLNAIGGGFDTARDVIMGLGNQANIGLDRYFHRPSAERDERLARKQAGQVRARDESIGDIGTQLYDIDQTVDAGGQLGNYPTDASAELGPGNQLLDRLLGTGHDTSVSTKDSIGAQIAKRKAAQEFLMGLSQEDIQTLFNQAHPEPTGTDRFAGQSKPPPPRPSAPGTDIEAGVTTLPIDSDNPPLVDLVNQLAPLNEAQRAGLLSQLDPETRDIILGMLDDRDNIDTGI